MVKLIQVLCVEMPANHAKISLAIKTNNSIKVANSIHKLQAAPGNKSAIYWIVGKMGS